VVRPVAVETAVVHLAIAQQHSLVGLSNCTTWERVPSQPAARIETAIITAAIITCEAADAWLSRRWFLPPLGYLFCVHKSN